MAKVDYSKFFEDKPLITLTNEQRKYLALEDMKDDWEVKEFFSGINYRYTRNLIYFEEDIIVKIVTQSIYLDEEDEIRLQTYAESDAFFKTDNKEFILPLTAKGKPKKVTPTNVMNIDPFGMTFDITIDSSGTYMRIINFRGCSQIFIGEEDRVAKVRNNDDFQAFMEYYISSCPDNYFEKVHRVKNAKHQTVKYKAGDIFRVEVDRFNYTYGLITGIIKDFKKWEEYPDEHSFDSLMGVPVAVRLYDITTHDDSLKADDLKDVPLDVLQICFDNDIIWGTHPVVDHKELTEDDVQFNLVCVKRIYNNEHHTLFTDEFLIRYGNIKRPIINTIYVEWGFSNVHLDYACISQELKQKMQEYTSPYIGVRQIIRKLKKTDPLYKYSLFAPHNKEMKEEIFTSLGLDKDATFDDFARKFGGLTKAEIVKRINKKK